MARPVHAAMVLHLAACLLFQVANCSRPAPEEPRIPASSAAVPRPALPRSEPCNKHGGGTTGTSRAAAAVVEGRTHPYDGEATSSSAITSSVLRGKDGNDGSVPGGNNWSAALLRSKLARRFLAATGVVESGDSAAGPSCRSSDVHNKSCPPASNKG